MIRPIEDDIYIYIIYQKRQQNDTNLQLSVSVNCCGLSAETQQSHSSPVVVEK